MEKEIKELNVSLALMLKAIEHTQNLCRLAVEEMTRPLNKFEDQEKEALDEGKLKEM